MKLCESCKHPEPKWEEVHEVCENGREYHFLRCEHCDWIILLGQPKTPPPPKSDS